MKILFVLPLLAVVVYGRFYKTSTMHLILQLCALVPVEALSYLAFHALIYRWFMSPTKDLPYPAVSR
jgi:hypothetical protein